jgi:hypothetical protein
MAWIHPRVGAPKSLYLLLARDGVPHSRLSQVLSSLALGNADRAARNQKQDKHGSLHLVCTHPCNAVVVVVVKSWWRG